MQLTTILRAMAVLLIGVLSVLVMSGQANADPKKHCEASESGSYSCTETDTDEDEGDEDEGDAGTPGDEGTPEEPSCQLYADFTFCMGDPVT